MNQTEYPLLSDAVEGFVFQTQNTQNTVDVDHKALEVSCINLIGKLENSLAKAKLMAKDDFIDEAAAIGRSMLEKLSQFNSDYLTGNASKQVKEELDRATTFACTYEEVLKTRSLTNALVRTFWKIEESKEIMNAHAKLGESLVRACAATFYHAVMLIGLSSDFGKEIDQSTVVFVNELQQSWN